MAAIRQYKQQAELTAQESDRAALLRLVAAAFAKQVYEGSLHNDRAVAPVAVQVGNCKGRRKAAAANRPNSDGQSIAGVGCVAAECQTDGDNDAQDIQCMGGTNEKKWRQNERRERVVSVCEPYCAVVPVAILSPVVVGCPVAAAD